MDWQKTESSLPSSNTDVLGYYGPDCIARTPYVVCHLSETGDWYDSADGGQIGSPKQWCAILAPGTVD